MHLQIIWGSKAFLKAEWKYSLIFAKQRKDGKENQSLWVSYLKDYLKKMGDLNFNFPTLQHHIFFELQQNFYTLKLREPHDKSKHTMIMLKLIDS